MDRQDGYEAYHKWPGRMGSGFFYILKFRPGLILTITNHNSVQPVSIRFRESSACVILSFILSGSLDIRTDGGIVQNAGADDRILVLAPAQSYLSNTRGNRGVAEYPEGDFCVVAVTIEPGLLTQFWDGDRDTFTEDLCRRLCISSPYDGFHRSMAVTPIMHMRLHDILGCRYQGGKRRFYLESKVLELLVLGLSQLSSEILSAKTCFAGECLDYEAVSRARDIMVRNMKHPPSLGELSRQVGVNRKKLNLCFKEVYGTSIFNYLRTCRLETARNLLRYSRKNVTEVAFDVGYAQQSNFTKAFKKHFGLSPRDCMG